MLILIHIHLFNIPEIHQVNIELMNNDTIFTMNEQTSGFVEPCV